jgi:hypothetical protein
MYNSTFPTNFSVKISVVELYHTSLVIWTATVLIINIFGALANAVTFAATMTYRPLRTSSSRVLLTHCIFLDFFLAICTHPGAVFITYHSSAKYPPHFCQGWGAIVFGSYYANNWAHCLLAINRFVAAVLPHYYRYITTQPVLRLAVTFPWLISLAINFFPLAEINLRYAPMKPWMGCIPESPDLKSAKVMAALGVYIPYLVIGLSYSMVLFKAGAAASVRRRRVGDLVQPRIALGKRYEASKILFLCFLWQCIASFAIPIAVNLRSTVYFARPLTQLAFKGLQYVSSAVNPVCVYVCTFVGQNFLEPAPMDLSGMFTYSNFFVYRYSSLQSLETIGLESKQF